MTTESDEPPEMQGTSGKQLKLEVCSKCAKGSVKKGRKNTETGGFSKSFSSKLFHDSRVALEKGNAQLQYHNLDRIRSYSSLYHEKFQGLNHQVDVPCRVCHGRRL